MRKHYVLNIRRYAFILAFLLIFSQAIADSKIWSGSDDGFSWDKAANWFPVGIPTASDDVTVDMQSTNVLITDGSDVLNAKSLVVGGRTESMVTSVNLAYALITPDSNTDTALYIKKGGTVIMEGGGRVTLQGKLKTSEETSPNEPAFMFEAE